MHTSNTFNIQKTLITPPPKKIVGTTENPILLRQTDQKGNYQNIPAFAAAHYTGIYKNKKCENCSCLGHKSSHCRKQKPRKSYVKTTQLEGEDENIRKFVLVKILNKEVRLQLDSGSDLTIINYHTWKRIGKPTMLQTKKVARSVTGEKISFEGEVIINVTLKNKTKKLRLFVLKNTTNLFGTDWIQQFELWDSPISDFCQKIENHTTQADSVMNAGFFFARRSVYQVLNSDVGHEIDWRSSLILLCLV